MNDLACPSWTLFSPPAGSHVRGCWKALAPCKIVPLVTSQGTGCFRAIPVGGRGEAGETATFSHSPRWGFLLYHLRDQHPMSSRSSPQGRPTQRQSGNLPSAFFPQQCINDVSLPFRPEGGFYLIQTPERWLRHPAAPAGRFIPLHTQAHLHVLLLQESLALYCTPHNTRAVTSSVKSSQPRGSQRSLECLHPHPRLHRLHRTHSGTH